MTDAREHVRNWVSHERSRYADVKYADNTATHNRLVKDASDNPNLGESDDGVDIDLFTMAYYSRVKQFGLNTPQGRQALGKMIVTLTHHLERAVDVHGPMPRPGVPSGTIEPWEDLSA